jgi:hypothetical protein
VIQLEHELGEIGCDVDAETFREAVRSAFHEHFAGWTDEQLKDRPRKALRFCDLVRDRMGGRRIPDPTILRTLTNLRKRCQLRPPTGEGRRKSFPADADGPDEFGGPA